MTTTVRPYRAPDLGRILRLWEEVLAAISATRPTVSEEMAESFRADAETFTRQ